MQDKIGDIWTVKTNPEYIGTVVGVDPDGTIHVSWEVRGKYWPTSDYGPRQADRSHLMKLTTEPAADNPTRAWSLK